MNLRERLAELEHIQWMRWAIAIWDEVSQGRQERWQQYMVPYEKLTEEVKDLDREWADRIIAILKEVDDEERWGIHQAGTGCPDSEEDNEAAQCSAAEGRNALRRLGLL